MTLSTLGTAALLGVILVSACWLLFMSVITWAIVTTRNEESATVAETPETDPRTNGEDKRQRAEDSLLSGGERVAKGRQRDRRQR